MDLTPPPPAPPSATAPAPNPWPRRIIKGLAVYTGCIISLIATVVLVGSTSAKDRAVLFMALGLILIWCVAGGLLQLRYRDAVRARTMAWKADWRVKFFLSAFALILLEEVVTTSMTNLAPVFGSRRGEAFITASDNYFLVVGFHSV